MRKREREKEREKERRKRERKEGREEEILGDEDPKGVKIFQTLEPYIYNQMEINKIIRESFFFLRSCLIEKDGEKGRKR